ncbi:MAG: FAD-dependent oxidoreductase [Polyangiales bacterium]
MTIDISRRRFLQRVGAAGGATAVYQGLHALGLVAPETAYAGPPKLPPAARSGAQVLILGAGIAGLVAAHELGKLGYRVTVLEARARPGGRVFTVRRGSVIEERDRRQEVSFDDDPDLFFDTGAARLPQHHQGIIGYARELGVRLEVMSNENRNALLQTRRAFDGQPLRNQRVHADARGFVAELAAKSVDEANLGRPLSDEDKEKLRSFLRAFGDLDERLSYRGSARAGFRDLPGSSEGKRHDPLDLQQLLSADFWSKLYEHEESPVQVPTMLRPVGGMSKIPEALARSVGKRIHYQTQVTRLRRTGGGARVQFRELATGRDGSLEADYVLVTLQPGILRGFDHDFTPAVTEALAAPTETPLAKIAFQAERRFWELDDQIYGGISWTDHPITQIWYPSQGIHSKKGLLLGAYFLAQDDDFAKKSLAERIALAFEGGELLHPGRYRKHLTNGASILWSNVPHTSGATTRWSEELRKQHYPVLLSADGPYYFAGEYLSYVNGWQEGAVRSAHHAMTQIAATESSRVRRPELAR